MKRALLVLPVLLTATVAVLAMRQSAPLELTAQPNRVSEVETRDRDIAFYLKRVQEDPQSAGDYAKLAELYMQRAREAGDYEDFRRAERAARTSWSMRDRRNTTALLTLSSSLLAQHRFAEARVLAEQLVALDGERIGARALLAEIQLELGDYAAARESFASLEHAAEELSVAPRLARWFEMIGQTGRARELLMQARITALSRPDLPREQKAWFHLRLADFNLRYGHFREAEEYVEAGLRIAPEDVRLRSVWARAHYLRGDWAGVEALLAPSVNAADMAALSMLGDAYLQRGGRALAQNVFARIEQLARENPEPYARQWTQFRLDHGRELNATVQILERELRDRPDVLGHDQLAWGYYQLGRINDAQRTIEHALRVGTQDATLYYHAGLIARAAGNDAAARQYLSHALAINPRFHPLQSKHARDELSRL